MAGATTLIVVRFQVEGWHRWPDAVNHSARAYLAALHRHMWHVEAAVSVSHEDREIELHDFRDFCLDHFPAGNVGRESCEGLALGLADDITRQYGADRRVRVSVFEDGENGAEVTRPGRPDPQRERPRPG